MKGFEYTISQGHDTLYISNRPRTGFVSFIVADKQPSLLDVKERNMEARFDVSEADFVKLMERMYWKSLEISAGLPERCAVAMVREVDVEPQTETDSPEV